MKNAMPTTHAFYVSHILVELFLSCFCAVADPENWYGGTLDVTRQRRRGVSSYVSICIHKCLYGLSLYTCKIFVFTFQRLDYVVVVVHLCSLAVDLSSVIATVALSQFQLPLQVGHFPLPIVNRLVKLALSLVRLRRDCLRL